jgi:hypothetical protein
MLKTLRLLAVILFLIATFAVSTTSSAKATVVVAEGSSPIPTCQPGTGCSPW